MKWIHIAISIFLLLGSHVGFTQDLVHTEVNQAYQKGVELFEQQQFAAANNHFQKIQRYQQNVGEQEFTELKINAAYYEARCAAGLNNEDAPKLFNDFIEDHPDHPLANLAQFHLGNLYYQNSKYKDAIIAYEKVKIFNLSNSHVISYKFRLGYCYFYKKKFDKAKPFMQEVKSVESKYYYPAHYYYGYITYYQKDYKEALPAFKEAYKTKMYKPFVPYYVTQIYFRQEKYDKVVDYAGTILQVDHRLRFKRNIKYLLGQAYFKQAAYQSAIPYLKEYVAAARRVTDQDVYALGYSYYQVENYADATKQLKKLSFRDDSLSQNATYLLGDCFLKQDQKKHARNAFNEAAKLDYDPAVKEIALLNYAKLSYELEFHREAIQATQKFIESYPNSEYSVEAKELIADIFMTTRKYDEALEILETMELDKPKLKKAYQQVAFYRGVELFNEKKWKPAITHFDKSLEHPLNESFNAQAYFWKGEGYLQMKKWDQAIDNLEQFLSLEDVVDTLPKTVSYTTATYNLGYSYYKQADYNSALTYFEKAEKRVKSKQKDLVESHLTYQKMYPDIILRKADCNFLLKRYQPALQDYRTIIDEDMAGKDYAYYQSGVLFGLTGRSQKKIDMLRELVNNYSHRSLYIDDGLYALANAYTEAGQPKKAITQLERLISNFPKSYYVQKGLTKLGLIYYNLDKQEKAIEYYKKVVKQYPRTEASKGALISIREIYIEMNKPDAYVQYVESVSEAEITKSTKDSIIYQSAETQYVKGDCKEATKGFDKYLNKYPSGYFTLPAHYYRAECRYQNEKYNAALKDYEYVIRESRNRFTEKALLRASSIAHHQQKDSAKAYKYYKKLYEYSEYKDNNLTALKGLVQTAYQLKRYDKVQKFGQRLLDFDQATPSDIIMTRLFLGKTWLHKESLSKAMVQFTKVAEATKSQKGVQARYYIARIKYLRNKHEASMAACYEVINHIPSYDYWVAKSFILLGDNYVAQGDTFQAKATYQSIVDNYEGDVLTKVAQHKINQLKAKEKHAIKKPKEVPDSLMMKPDTLK